MMRAMAISLTVSLVCLSCTKKAEQPFENRLKQMMIESLKIEPAIESITINVTVDASQTQKLFQDRLKENKDYVRSEARVNYEKARKEYDVQKSVHGKAIADRIYLQDVERWKKIYDNAVNGVYPDYIVKQEERVSYPTIFQEITVRYKMSEQGAIRVERLGVDIFKGDTTLLPLAAGESILDYIKTKQ